MLTPTSNSLEFLHQDEDVSTFEITIIGTTKKKREERMRDLSIYRKDWERRRELI